MTAWCRVNSEAPFCFPTLSIKLLVKNGTRHNDYKRCTVKLYKTKTWIDHKTITKKTLNKYFQIFTDKKTLYIFVPAEVSRDISPPMPVSKSRDQSRPIRGQYPSHVMSIHQLEASVTVDQ